MDETLLKIIDEIWKAYNNFDDKEKVIVESITVDKNGNWEPELPEYIKALDKNLNWN